MTWLVFVSFAAMAGAQATSKSPWAGVWSGRLGDAGVIALNISDTGPGKVPNAGVWWLVEGLRLNSSRLENDTLFLTSQERRNLPPVALAFRLVGPNEIRLVPHGVLAAPLDPVFANLKLTRALGDNPWYAITNNYYKTSEWGKWHEGGTLKPLSAQWPAAVAEATARLLSEEVHAFQATLVQTTLTPAFLEEVWTWTGKKPWLDQTDYILAALAENPNTSTETLEKIWSHPEDARMWIAIAAHPHARPEWRQSLIDRIMNGSPRIKNFAIMSGKGPVELYLRLTSDADRQVREDLARSRKMPPAVYAELLREAPPGTRQTLAANPAVPVDLLEQLARQDDRIVKFTLIRNEHFPAEARQRLVRELALSARPGEMDQLAADPDLPPELLPRYAEELAPTVRSAVARNPHTGPELLTKLAGDDVALVAMLARDALKARYPNTLAGIQAGLRSLDSLDQSSSLHGRFAKASVRGDLEEVKRLADYLRGRGELDVVLTYAAPQILTTYQPAMMDYFVENGFGKYPATFTELASNCPDARWLPYFKNHGAFEKSLGARALVQALRNKKDENLRALLALGLDVNTTDTDGLTVLHQAVLLRRMDAVEFLLQAGARPDEPDSRRQTPLDYAVRVKFIPAIKLMDKEGKHAAMLEAYAKEFPPAPNSRFLGRWTNGRDGFGTVIIDLEPDGTARFATPVVGDIVAWHETGQNEAEVIFYDQKGTRLPVKLRLNPEGTELILTPPVGESQKMRRDKR